MKRLSIAFVIMCLALTLRAEEEDLTPTLVGPLSMPSVMEGSQPKAVEVSPFEAKKAVGFQARVSATKNLWADSWLFVPVPLVDDAGKIVPETTETENIPAAERVAKFLRVEEWYGQAPPSFDGKYVLVEFSASWCPVCRRDIANLNRWFEKYGEELIVISLYETDRASIDTLPGKFQGKDMKYYVGIDTQRRTANAMGVFGIPHIVVLEPRFGGVVWEGMPLQPGFELTDDVIEKILAVGRKSVK